MEHTIIATNIAGDTYFTLGRFFVIVIGVVLFLVCISVSLGLKVEPKSYENPVGTPAMEQTQKIFFGLSVIPLIIAVVFSVGPAFWFLVASAIFGGVFIQIIEKRAYENDKLAMIRASEKAARSMAEQAMRVEREAERQQEIAQLDKARMEEQKALQELQEKKKLEALVVAQQQEKFRKEATQHTVENYLFEFFNEIGFVAEFVDDPSDVNKGYPEIKWVFEKGLDSKNTIVPRQSSKNLNAFLKRQEFGVHIFKNRGSMSRNVPDLLQSGADEIYTHRKLENGMFIDKEAEMMIPNNYYVYLSIRTDNISFDGINLPKFSDFDWSIKPLRSVDKTYAYFEFDSHRITREEYHDAVSRKKQELHERQEMSRLKEMEEDLDDMEGGAANRLRKAAEKYKKGGMKQSQALDEVEKELLDEFEASGASEEDLEKFFEVLRKLRRDIEA